MGLEYDKLDSMQELIDKLYKLEAKRMYDMSTDELEALADGLCMDVDALANELTEHLEVFSEMKAVCEEMLNIVCDSELDD